MTSYYLSTNWSSDQLHRYIFLSYVTFASQSHNAREYTTDSPWSKLPLHCLNCLACKFISLPQLRSSWPACHPSFPLQPTEQKANFSLPPPEFQPASHQSQFPPLPPHQHLLPLLSPPAPTNTSASSSSRESPSRPPPPPQSTSLSPPPRRAHHRTPPSNSSGALAPEKKAPSSKSTATSPLKHPTTLPKSTWTPNPQPLRRRAKSPLAYLSRAPTRYLHKWHSYLRLTLLPQVHRHQILDPH